MADQGISPGWTKALGFGVDIPFVTHLGFELTAFADGLSEILYTAKPEHLNSFSVTHGGAIMTLMDVSMATAARSVVPEMGVVTIEMKTSFMQPSIGALVARGHLIHRTATLAFTESTIFDAAGKVCAHATGTFKFVKRLPTGSKSANPLQRQGSGISTD